MDRMLANSRFSSGAHQQSLRSRQLPVGRIGAAGGVKAVKQEFCEVPSWLDDALIDLTILTSIPLLDASETIFWRARFKQIQDDETLPDWIRKKALWQLFVLMAMMTSILTISFLRGFTGNRPEQQCGQHQRAQSRLSSSQAVLRQPVASMRTTDGHSLV